MRVLLRSIFSLSALAGIFLSAAPLSAAEKTSRNWALLVGVNDYAYISQLRYCSHDMQALQQQLLQCGFPAEQVFLLSDGAADSKHLPLKPNIERHLKLVLDTLVGPDDLVIVAFAGHGIIREGESFYCPTEADLEDPAGTMISIKAVYDQLEKCPARFKLLIVDACRNDPRLEGQRSVVPDEEVKLFKIEDPPKGIMLLTSCAAGEVSWESRKFKHGVFTHFLISGLQGEADQHGNKNGKISLTELWEYAHLQTKTFVARTHAISQQPSLKGEIEGVFEIGVSRTMTNSIGMKLVLIPPGVAEIGASPDDTDSNPDEALHKARLTSPFYIAMHEVTQGEYEAVTGKIPSYFSPGGKGAARVAQLDHRQLPVDSVTYHDAVQFCHLLSELPAEREAGRVYRLPSESEWEYCCRAGTDTPYWTGSELTARHANIGQRQGRTTPVGSFAPNRFGLHDTHGNVWEWCGDWYAPYPSEATDPRGPESGKERVLRGGSWLSGAGEARSAFREHLAPDKRTNGDGFRIVCEIK